jgi:hypothetical protein
MGRTHPNLVGHWRFENNLLDTSGNGNDGTVGAGSAAYANGTLGLAADFNPSGFVWADTGVQLGATWTVNFWVRPKTLVNGYFFSQTDTISAGRLILGEDGSRLFAFVGSNVAARFAPTLNQWYHFSMSKNETGLITWYVDCEARGSITNTAPQTANQSQVGGSSVLSGRNTNSVIDDVQIWNRALQPHHIRAIYNGVDPAFLGDIA